MIICKNEKTLLYGMETRIWNGNNTLNTNHPGEIRMVPMLSTLVGGLKDICSLGIYRINVAPDHNIGK